MWSETPPDPELLAELAPQASCRGCGRGLWRAAGGRWEDGDGITVCVKSPLSYAAGPDGQVPGLVFHEPMPEGLRGAPSRSE